MVRTCCLSPVPWAVQRDTAITDVSVSSFILVSLRPGVCVVSLPVCSFLQLTE